MFETMVEFILSDHLGGLTFEPPAGEVGYNRILTPNRRPFRTLDGHVAILLHTDRHWERFFDVIGEPEKYRADPRLHDPVVRRAHYGDAYGVVAAILAARTSAQWLELLGAADIPIMPVNDVAELLDDPHLRATGFFGIEQHPSEGPLLTLRAPSRWSECDLPAPSPAPRLGNTRAKFSPRQVLTRLRSRLSEKTVKRPLGRRSASNHLMLAWCGRRAAAPSGAKGGADAS